MPVSIKSSELDKYLIPPDAPINKGTTISAIGFNAQNDRNSVNRYNIKNLSIGNAQLGTAIIGTAQVGTLTFNQISGGTATLGGTTNGNGLLSVKNAAGSEIVKADNTGLTVTGGSITINDKNGSAIVDSTGINSVNSFPNNYYQSGSTISTTNGTSWVNIVGGSTTFVNTRSSNVFIYFSGLITYGGNVGVSQQRWGANMTIFIDGTAQGYPSAAYLDIGGQSSPVISITEEQTISRGDIYTLTAGTHTLEIKWQSTSDGQNVNMGNRTLFYIGLGK